MHRHTRVRAPQHAHPARARGRSAGPDRDQRHRGPPGAGVLCPLRSRERAPGRESAPQLRRVAHARRDREAAGRNLRERRSSRQRRRGRRGRSPPRQDHHSRRSHSLRLHGHRRAGCRGPEHAARGHPVRRLLRGQGGDGPGAAAQLRILPRHRRHRAGRHGRQLPPPPPP